MGATERHSNLDVVPIQLAAADLPPRALVGEYQIERKLGEGAMGSVYAAIHAVLGKRVALKVISLELSHDAEAMARFRREARVVAQLESAHIVSVFAFGELPDGRAYFVMEYLAGESLGARLERGRVPLDEALDIIAQTAQGLEAAHAAGVVHRDLKPDNLFLERRGGTVNVKILDYGIAKVATDDGIARTQAGVLIGTPLYMAPEQASHASEVDHRADIYALGGVAYELVVGRLPFPYETIVELVAAHLTALPPSPRSIAPEIPAALDALLVAMLAKEPSKRPTLGHVQEVIEKLRRSAFELVVRGEASSAAPSVHSMRAKHHRRAVVIAGAAVAIGIAVIALVIATRHGDATSSAKTDDGSANVKISPIEVTVAPAPTPGAPAPVLAGPALAGPKPAPAVAAPARHAGTRAVPPPRPPKPATVAPSDMLHVPHVDPNGSINPFAAKGSGR